MSQLHRRFRLFRISCSAAAIVAGATVSHAAGPALFDAWSDGKAEVNTYDLTEGRYGDARRGNAVLIFVSEELDRNSYVKVETDQTPQNDRMYVIKLNKIYRFPTGIYDYSVMTTVFSVVDSHLGHHPFQAARVSNTTQEWCGQVFQRLDLQEDGWHHELRSYFEREGDQKTVLPAGLDSDDLDPPIWGERSDCEDNLWIWIRELDGAVLAPGESRQLAVAPALWELRKSHRPIALHSSRVTKGAREPFDTQLGRFDAFRWSWEIDGRIVSVWVEADGAHRLLGWEDSSGGHARIIASVRVPYWQMNGNSDIHWRNELLLPSQEVLEP